MKKRSKIEIIFAFFFREAICFEIESISLLNISDSIFEIFLELIKFSLHTLSILE